MGTEAAWIPAVIGVVASAVGTGISVYAQNQQAESAAAIANYNFQIQQRNSKIQSEILAQSAAYEAETNRNNAITQQNNARALEDQGRAAEAQAREQAERTREEGERLKAMQRARYAKSGVTTEGTPIQVMAETAGLLELGVQDALYQADLTGRAYDRKAALARLDASQAVFDEQISKYEGAAAQAGVSIKLNQAKVDRLSGLSLSQGYANQAVGSLFSGMATTSDRSTKLFKS